jgi:hypothetical protein
MAQKIRKERITKRDFYDRGGFSNPALFRQQSRGGAWRYYVDIERDQQLRDRIDVAMENRI